MLIPRNSSNTPPGMWRFPHPQTGYMIGGAFSIGRLIAMVRDYGIANGYPEIEGLEAKIIAYMCEVEPDYCHSTDPPTLAERMARFARASIDWIANGARVVPHDVFEARLAICEQCHYWQGYSSFGSVSCRKCGCSGKKLSWATESCPDTPKKWKEHEFNQ